ncbi:thiol:disulfide interchange protein DsbA/DsbL [Endozoicomonas sp. SESOKO3]|uniref:thiol:disulfide interchange protein DsbA/DsbL n=1 Tax=Endozoicomonas sp. SESOKO3 TaxID=2828744 RepID=UPI0021481449|nr:thiol:disulfide interchange protein DsbA/DsbL [Endozoicomonas sp. SESOKO3]
MPKQLKFLWLALVLPLMAQAAVEDKYKEGQDYQVLSNPVQTSVKKSQIEVAEVFWYGCPHCYTLEPIVARWKPSLEKDTRVVRTPGFFGPNIWKAHAQLYYTLETIIPEEKKLNEIHESIFAEIQNRNNRLGDVRAMGDFLQNRHGIDPKQFASFYNSFGVLNLMNQGGSKIKGYQLNGVPALVVDGRYVIEPRVGLENMPVIADFLIKKVRDERAAKAEPEAKQASQAKS